MPAQDVWPPVPGALVSVFAQQLIWRPGGSSRGNIVATWGEVQNAIANTNGAITILVDDSIAPATVPVGTTDCQSRVIFTSAFQHELPSTVKMILPDGAILRDVRAINGFLTVELHGSTTPNFQFTNDRALGLDDGGVISNVGSQPAVRLAPGGFFVITFSDSSIFSNVTPGAGPLVDLGAGAIAVLFSVTSGGYTTDNTVTGVAGSVAQFQFDASLGQFPANPGFAGTIQKFVVDDAGFMSYAPAVIANWSGFAPTSVADALDRIAAKIGPIP